MRLLFVILFGLGLLFIACLLGTTIGALSGFVVGLAFDESLGLLAKILGIPEAQPYQLGAIFGFLSGFLHNTVRVNKE